MALEAHVSARSRDNAGQPLYPHKHKDGAYVASHSRYEVDYVRVATVEQLQSLVEFGYGAMMSNPELRVAPSLIISKNINITGKHTITEALYKAYEALELDTDSSCKRRTEQTFLRAQLLNGAAFGKCVICSEELPENLLVAAHIKKRSFCTREEKLDFGSIAALMCKLGCDDLYEKGYIYVHKASVCKNPKISSTTFLNKAISQLVGKKVLNWSSSQKYYAWHKDRWAKKA